MPWLIITIIILLIAAAVAWNVYLVGYHDKHTHYIEPHEEECFSPTCRPIVLQHQDTPTQAILMIHGFPATPRTYEYSSQRMFEAGYDVYVPLMPGFGTSVQEFEQTYYPQWFGYIRTYYEHLRSKYPKLVVLGISMGGAITLNLAEEFCNTPLAPDAVVAIAAPVVYNSLLRDRIITNPGAYIMRTAGLFVPDIGGAVQCGNPQSEDGNEDWTGYHGLFIHQGISLIHALKPIRRNLYKITCPLLSIHDVHDKTVPFGNQAIIERETRSTRYRKIISEMPPYRHTRHCLLSYHSVQKQLTDAIIEFLQEDQQ